MDLMSMFLPLILAAIVLLLLAKLIVSDADGSRTASEVISGKIEFVPNRRSYFGVYLFVGFLTYVAVAGLVTGLRTQLDLISPLSCVGFVAIILAAFPASIVVDANGVEQVYWLRGRRRIAWKDIVSVDVNEKKHEVRIKGKNRVKIVHTRLLPDRSRLLAELDKHASERALVAVPKRPAESEREIESERERSQARA
jgi:Bacterial PH domain